MDAFYFPSYVFLHLFEFPPILNLQNNYTDRKIMNVLTKRTEANVKNLTAAVAQRCSVKKVFLEISQNSQENTSARVSFLIKLFSCEFCEISKNTFSCRTPLVAASEFVLVSLKINSKILGTLLIRKSNIHIFINF